LRIPPAGDGLDPESAARAGNDFGGRPADRSGCAEDNHAADVAVGHGTLSQSHDFLHAASSTRSKSMFARGEARGGGKKALKIRLEFTGESHRAVA
jgi:hypothetical protein